MQIKTLKLQKMLAKAVKGAGNEKTRPQTELLSVKLEGGKLTITSTSSDLSNYLYVQEDVEGDDFYAVVYVDQFSKLIARTTSEYVTLTVKGNILEIVGNGEYTIPVELDVETGEMLDYPNPIKDFKKDKKIGEMSIATLKTILNAVKPSVDTSNAVTCYSNIYVGDSVMATDVNKMSLLSVNVLSEPKLLSVTTIDLLEVLSEEDTIKVYEQGGKLLFEGDCGMLYAPAMEGLASYQVDSIKSYVSREYPSKCTLPKLEILQSIDRLSLFVEGSDEGLVNIEFTKDEMKISSIKSTFEESIPYTSCDAETLVENSGQIYLEMLRSQIKAQTGDTLEVYFGDKETIKFIDSASNIISVCCLAE